jgi:hypothetical protein
MMKVNLLRELLQKVLIFFCDPVTSMDELDLILTKWDTMNNPQRAIVSILVMGAIAIALDAVFHFIGEYIQPILGVTIREPLNILIYTILTVLFASITILTSNRERENASKALDVERKKHDKEITQWRTDCQWLYNENDKLRKLVNQFMPKSNPAHLGLSSSIVLEQTTPEEAKRGEIHKRLSEK